MSSFLRHTWDLIVKGAMLAAGFLRGLSIGDNPAIVLLLALMVADYLSGLVAAFLKKSRKSISGGLSSQAGAKGLLKKGLMLLVVLLAYALDSFVGQGNAMFQNAVTWFYISNEALSLLENLALAGVPIPKRLKDALERLSQEEMPDGEIKQEAQETAGLPEGETQDKSTENVLPKDAEQEDAVPPSQAPAPTHWTNKENGGNG